VSSDNVTIVIVALSLLSLGFWVVALARRASSTTLPTQRLWMIYLLIAAGNVGLAAVRFAQDGLEWPTIVGLTTAAVATITSFHFWRRSAQTR